MQVRNKQNSKYYTVIETVNNNVTLKREDGSVFTITKSEFNFSYFIKKQLTY